MTVTLRKITDTPVPTQPSEWELDRRRSERNPLVDRLPVHREGLAANDLVTLRSAFMIMFRANY
jgi:hypothetical protein